MGYLDYWQATCAILREPVILLALGVFTFSIWVSSDCSFIFLLSDGNVKPLHLIRNKSLWGGGGGAPISGWGGFGGTLLMLTHPRVSCHCSQYIT